MRADAASRPAAVVAQAVVANGIDERSNESCSAARRDSPHASRSADPASRQRSSRPSAHAPATAASDSGTASRHRRRRVAASAVNSDRMSGQRCAGAIASARPSTIRSARGSFGDHAGTPSRAIAVRNDARSSPTNGR